MQKTYRRLIFNLSYLFRPRWDTHVPAPEIVRYVEDRAPGNALDIGCGTGTNILFLARRGWAVTGVDFAPLAIRKARGQLKGYPAHLVVADVAALRELELPGPYGLAIDMGCFHSLAEQDRGRYAAGLQRWVVTGGMFMLYAFQPSAGSSVPGLTREQVTGYFGNTFTLAKYEQGQGRPSAWYYFERQ
jgi:SAM-dependent methyltransferase